MGTSDGMIRTALFVAFAALSAGFLLAYLERELDDGPPRILISKSESPYFGCTSKDNVEKMLRASRSEDFMAVLTMVARGVLGDGCVLIHQGDELTYYGDPREYRLLKARLRGYPDMIWVPSGYIPKMLGES